MGRQVLGGSAVVTDPEGTASSFIYTGCGVNVQASYLFNRKWEVALRNSTMLPDEAVQPLLGYRTWNQTTLGITRQMDLSYNTREQFTASPLDDRWSLRFQVELGL